MRILQVDSLTSGLIDQTTLEAFEQSIDAIKKKSVNTLKVTYLQSTAGIYHGNGQWSFVTILTAILEDA